jgi:hypothetical protein
MAIINGNKYGEAINQSIMAKGESSMANES